MYFVGYELNFSLQCTLTSKLKALLESHISFLKSTVQN
jgi:hypothetical protein